MNHFAPFLSPIREEIEPFVNALRTIQQLRKWDADEREDVRLHTEIQVLETRWKVLGLLRRLIAKAMHDADPTKNPRPFAEASEIANLCMLAVSDTSPAQTGDAVIKADSAELLGRIANTLHASGVHSLAHGITAYVERK